MNIKKEIQNYIPFNEQENKDKKNWITFLENFEDTLTRNNTIGHITSSAFVVNESLSKSILLYHNIYEGYIFPGGHADGDNDLLHVAIKEVYEETGLKVKPLINDIFAIQCLPAKGHIRKGKYVSAHTHFDVMYLLTCPDKDMKKIRIQEDENKDVKWVDLDSTYSNDVIDWVKPINKKVVQKIKKLLIEN